MGGCPELTEGIYSTIIWTDYRKSLKIHLGSQYPSKIRIEHVPYRRQKQCHFS